MLTDGAVLVMAERAYVCDGVRARRTAVVARGDGVSARGGTRTPDVTAAAGAVGRALRELEPCISG